MPRKKKPVSYEVVELFAKSKIWQFVVAKKGRGLIVERFLIENHDDENPSWAKIRAEARCGELNANATQG